MEFGVGLCDALFSHSYVVVLSRVKFVNMTETDTIQFFNYTERTPLSQFKILLFRIFSKTQEVSCNVFYSWSRSQFRIICWRQCQRRRWLVKMSWIAMPTDMRRRRYYIERSTHSYLTHNEVRQSKTTKDKDNNNDTTRQYTAESFKKLNMNILKHFSENWRNQRLTNFTRIDVTLVSQTSMSSGSSKGRHTRSSELKHHGASSTFLDETLILSRPFVSYLKKRASWSDAIIVASAVKIVLRRLRWQDACIIRCNCM